MVYRTRTYIAGDWTGDADLINKLHMWNDSDYWGLSFTDAHEMTQARDTSLPCSIKRSLKERLDGSKTFVLVLGEHTTSLTKGSCRYCPSYVPHNRCARGHSVNQQRLIDYECRYAMKHGLKTVVLYNASYVNKAKCPDAFKVWASAHIAAYQYDENNCKQWNYAAIKKELEE
jgi:hypothetical protein